MSEVDLEAERQRLYEVPALRDDLNDPEASILLKWADEQLQRLAAQNPPNLEKQVKYFMQMVKGINRFVGQREFNDEAGQQRYMKQITMWLPQLSLFDGITEDMIRSALPEDKADMNANLQGILGVLSPDTAEAETPQDDNPPAIDAEPSDDNSASEAGDRGAASPRSNDAPVWLPDHYYTPPTPPEPNEPENTDGDDEANGETQEH